MFLRCRIRKKNGKEHHFWSVVESHLGPRHILLLRRDQSLPARRREGRHFLRIYLGAEPSKLLWRSYLQLVFVEEAFRTLI